MEAVGTMHCTCSKPLGTYVLTKHVCHMCDTLSAELLQLEDAVAADVL